MKSISKSEFIICKIKSECNGIQKGPIYFDLGSSKTFPDNFFVEKKNQSLIYNEEV